MSSIDEFRSKLLEDARRKAEEILRRGEEEARRIIEEAENKRRALIEAEKTKIISEARRKAELIVSEARRKARLIITQAKQELLAEVFNKAYNKIGSREGFSVEKSLENLLDEALSYVKNPSRVIVNPRDRGIIEKLVAKKNIGNVVIEASEKVDGGLIVVSAEGEVVDNTYRTRLQRAYESLAPVIVKRIWGR